MALPYKQSRAQHTLLQSSPVEWRIGSENLTPALLAQHLTAPYKKEKEKVEAIFFWITDNIAYRSSYATWQRSPLKKKISPLATLFEDSSLNQRVAYNVLQEGYAVCDGYARLFKTLCDYAGIKSEIITGYARSNGYRSNTAFKSNHSWNAVYFDSAWHLLDATWASGHFTFNSPDFVKQYNGSYFLTAPSSFSFDHYPEDLRWSLMERAPMMREFYHTPFKYTAYLKYKISSFTPSKGIIQASIGDTLTFELLTPNKEKDKGIAPENNEDSIDNPAIVTLMPDKQYNASNTTYSYIVPSADVAWIQLMYNKDIIMRYRLEVVEKKE
ncbi:MAG TPA: transglutaminase domain-containing protein [Chitinophagaceae bacterium]|nr:transglutaminase domain-containing protein [Chitinophagaceae bacterium]